MLTIQKYLSKHDNEYANFLQTFIEKLKHTIITLHFPPKLDSEDPIYNYTTLFTGGIETVIIRYNGTIWSCNILRYEYTEISEFEDVYIENVINHFLYAEDSETEKIIPWNDGTLHSLKQPLGQLSLPRKLRSENGENIVEKP